MPAVLQQVLLREMAMLDGLDEFAHVSLSQLRWPVIQNFKYDLHLNDGMNVHTLDSGVLVVEPDVSVAGVRTQIG